MRVGIIGYGLMGKRRAEHLGDDLFIGFHDPLGRPQSVDLATLFHHADTIIVSTPTPLLVTTVMSPLPYLPIAPDLSSGAYVMP